MLSKEAPGQSYRSGISVAGLFRMFPDDHSARTWSENIRWPDNERYYPHCGGMEPSGTVEIDKTYIGVKESNKHASRKLTAGVGRLARRPWLAPYSVIEK